NTSFTAPPDTNTLPYVPTRRSSDLSYSGFKNSETLATSGVTGSPSLTTAATAASSVAGSPYTITAALGTLAAGNYSFAFVNGQRWVEQTTLAVTAYDNRCRYRHDKQ